MRHSDAGLAIPDFPWMFGHVIPDHWDPKIAVHFAHRVGALIVVLSVIATSAHIWYHHRDRRELTRPATLILLLVAVQVTLGALTVLTQARHLDQQRSSGLRRARAGHVHRHHAEKLAGEDCSTTVRLKPDTTTAVRRNVRSVRLQADRDVRLQPDQGSRT